LFVLPASGPFAHVPGDARGEGEGGHGGADAFGEALDVLGVGDDADGEGGLAVFALDGGEAFGEFEVGDAGEGDGAAPPGG
jgi:hypothetical protein